MNILFLGLGNHKSIKERSISLDLLRVFMRNGHKIYIVCPLGSGEQQETVISEGDCQILKVNVGRIQKTNVIRKGINTVLLEKRFIKAIKKHYNNVKFDLILYPTPPISFLSVVEYIKKRDNAKAYLMLKDIFPQNAVDIGMMSKTGVSGFIYSYFRKKEKKLYKVSDYIGCMSPANVDFVLNNNPDVSRSKVGICPNSVEIEDKSVSDDTRKEIRDKYGIPQDKTVFIYGGNLGRPQGIPFLIRCLKAVKNVDDAFFLIVGDGTEYEKINKYASSSDQRNMKLLKRLPKEDYDSMVGACDVGMIFLDHRFTIPNFPSRLLSYMQARIPVLACTDPNTDIGECIVDGKFGWWCESKDEQMFRELVLKIIDEKTQGLGDNGFDYLLSHFNVEDTFNTIMTTVDALDK